MADIPEGPPISWGWVGYVVPVVVALGVIWGLVKGYFELVTRKELVERLKEMEAARQARDSEMLLQRDKQHAENKDAAAQTRDTLREMFERLGNVEKSVAHINGELTGRRRGPNG